MRSLESRDEVLSFLVELGAPEHLLRHLELVGEVAALLVEELRGLGVSFDARLVELGAAIHDAGKIVHPEEMSGGGNEHEPAGERFMLEQGVDPRLARFCLSHSRYQELEVSFEELVVALADTLWKGRRQPELELEVIDQVARKLGVERWDVFPRLDACFEEIAAQGDERLGRSLGG
ncbi:MAG: HD domain-containing protein [Pseudomonadota bacterium]